MIRPTTIIHDIEELIPGNNLCEVSGMDRVHPEWYQGELADYNRAVMECGDLDEIY